MSSKLTELFEQQGQSPWLDFIRRNMLMDGGLQRYVDRGIRGVTANPTIFAQAIAAGDDYDEQIRKLLKADVPIADMFERLATDDIRLACDILEPVFVSSNGSDGFVSIEVSPDKAYDTEGTIDEAKRWWTSINRPNLMVKIPATDAGIPAIEECLATGININITLIFAISFYERVMDAYVRALERRLALGQDLASTNSVASFFVSRVDTAVDKKIEERLSNSSGAAEQSHLATLLGKAAIANAKVAYQQFLSVFHGERFAKLQAAGANVQRPLWASTGTKNKAYSDLLYVDNLIGPDTVNTMPPLTIDAFEEHGAVERTIDADADGAARILLQLEEAGISLAEITDELQRAGVESFANSFEEIFKTTSKKVAEIKAKSAA